jgi:hypothetical protein
VRGTGVFDPHKDFNEEEIEGGHASRRVYARSREERAQSDLIGKGDGMKYLNARLLLVGLVVFSLSPAANAGQRFSFDGVQYAQGHVQAVAMEEGHAVVLVKWDGIHAAKDPESPFHLLRTECPGMIDSRRDGSFDSSGYCMHTLRDGSKWVGRWWNNDKMPEGRFEVFYGEGRWSGATGGGTAKCTPLKPGSPETLVCEIKGMIEAK